MHLRQRYPYVDTLTYAYILTYKNAHVSIPAHGGLDWKGKCEEDAMISSTPGPEFANFSLFV